MIGGVTTDVGSDTMGRTTAVLTEAAGKATGVVF